MKTLNKAELNSHIAKLAASNKNFNSQAFFNYIADEENMFNRAIHSIIETHLFGFRFTASNDHKAVDPKASQHLEVGQLVTYVNDYGCAFPNKTVIGFCEDKYGNSVYISSDSYWCSVSPKSLVLQDGWIAITQEQIDSIGEEEINRFKPYNYDMLKEDAELAKAS